MAGFGSSEGTFTHLQSLFNDNEEIQMRRFLRDTFDVNQQRVFSLALTLATQTRYLFKSKQKSIPEVLFNELREWLKTKVQKVITFIVFLGRAHIKNRS